MRYARAVITCGISIASGGSSGGSLVVQTANRVVVDATSSYPRRSTSRLTSSHDALRHYPAHFPVVRPHTAALDTVQDVPASTVHAQRLVQPAIVLGTAVPRWLLDVHESAVSWLHRRAVPLLQASHGRRVVVWP